MLYDQYPILSCLKEEKIKLYLILSHFLTNCYISGSAWSEPGASGDIHLLPDVLRLHELEAEHPAVQMLCPFWSDAYCRYKHLCLDQDCLQGGDKRHCSLQ